METFQPATRHGTLISSGNNICNFIGLDKKFFFFFSVKIFDTNKKQKISFNNWIVRVIRIVNCFLLGAVRELLSRVLCRRAGNWMEDESDELISINVWRTNGNRIVIRKMHESSFMEHDLELGLERLLTFTTFVWWRWQKFLRIWLPKFISNITKKNFNSSLVQTSPSISDVNIHIHHRTLRLLRRMCTHKQQTTNVIIIAVVSHPKLKSSPNFTF